MKERQIVTLMTPTLKPGELVLEVWKNFGNVSWDSHTPIGHTHDYFLFSELLESSGWHELLICRLEHSFFHWETGRPRISMMHQILRRVSIPDGEWVLETLPPVYEKASSKFNELRPVVVEPDPIEEEKKPQEPKVIGPVVARQKLRRVEAGSD